MNATERALEETGRVVEQTIEIGAPKEAVWSALTDAGELARWFPLQARTTPGVGGNIWMSWGGLWEGQSLIEVWEPGEHLRTRFPSMGARELATDYYLEGEGGQTTLRVVTSGFGTGEDWDNDYYGVKFGWMFELESLKHYLESHPGEDRIVAHFQRTVEPDRTDLWDLLMGPGGLFDTGEGSPPTSGRRYSAQIAGKPMHGEIRSVARPKQLVATIEELNDAIFRIELESHGPGEIWIWLATHGVAANEVEKVRARWEANVDALLRTSN